MNKTPIERQAGSVSLTIRSRTGDDDETCRIICTVASLHISRQKLLPALIPLAHGVRALEPMAQTYGGILTRCNEAAKILLSAPMDAVNGLGDEAPITLQGVELALAELER
ncbi:hypothetical protein Xbed_03567 [Xenorhabdus beddingii]|uniref:Uncharacterized protein n=1 Tax=Xenorhabdus beddingii TaxID=40578 RepID=A0A1Y2SCG3_9GAMM|nr:aminoglycoside phosphotransferase family protein [Xenorhabdus beddingii]OTA15639.1 hypothetical protein Xbed_03567 [Xenorhabdus beddingii]